ncbi:MAG: hypothetical protein AB8B85_10460 [Paracoccaceae bacterium]
MAEATGKMEKLVDQALADLAREVEAKTPRPSADLMARVLSDAASVAPARTDQTMDMMDARPRTLADILFGWTGGAVAALTLCMTMGVAIGMEISEDQMPMMGDTVEIAEADPLGILPEDFI